jgi:hypothetical protein
MFGVVDGQEFWEEETGVSRGERWLNGEESSVGETFAGGVGEHLWMTGNTILVQSRWRDSFVQKLHVATLATLIAISMLATHTWHAIFGPRPSLVKSIFM